MVDGSAEGCCNTSIDALDLDGIGAGGLRDPHVIGIIISEGMERKTAIYARPVRVVGLGGRERYVRFRVGTESRDIPVGAWVAGKDRAGVIGLV